jgi:hypothetical protein
MTRQPVSLNPAPRTKLRYANVLRCIGQNLESMEIKAVEVRAHGEDYVVQVWNRGTSTSMDFEKRYRLEDLKQLELEGRAKRRPFSGPANLLSLSHALRLAGGYVDRAWGRLVRVAWQDQSDKIQSVTIQYEPFHGHGSESSEAHVATIEELCIHVYKQRKKIASGSDKSAHRPFVGVRKSS